MLHLTVCKQKIYLFSTELFEIEFFICIKMDLAFHNLQRLICHKPKQTIKMGHYQKFFIITHFLKMGRYYLFLSLLITQFFLKWVVIIHFYHYSLLTFS